MKTIKQQSAFSLIELSVVILIIGILVIGISQGSRIIKEAKLKTAQQLTTSSAVNSISGLRLWAETSLEKSFDANEAINGTIITSWYNTNTQDVNLNGTRFQSVSDRRPIYINAGINGLPTLRFDGIDDYLLSSLPLMATDQLTVFMVCKRSAWVSRATTASFTNVADGGDGFTPTTFVFSSEASAATFVSERGGVGAITTQPHPGNNKPYILASIFNGTNNILYLNGSASTTGITSGNFLIDRVVVGSRIAGNNPNISWNGDISEIIVFDKALSVAERKGVEAYLSQKYGIKVN